MRIREKLTGEQKSDCLPKDGLQQTSYDTFGAKIAVSECSTWSEYGQNLYSVQTLICRRFNLLSFQMTMLTKEQVNLIISGLLALEGAMSALHQPIPPEVDELKKELLSQQNEPNSIGNYALSTKTVAQLLGYSTRRVNQLGASGYIRPLQLGSKGRGRTYYYDAESVRNYVENRNKQ